MQEGRGYLEPTKDLETEQQQQAPPPPSFPPHSPGRRYPPSSFRRGSYSGSLAAPEYAAYAPTAGAMSSYPVGHPQNQDQAQRGHDTLYNPYPSRQFAPNDSLYSPATAAAYYQNFPHSRTPTTSTPSYAPRHATSFHYLPDNRSVVPDGLYSNHTTLSLPDEPITGNSYNPAATNMMNLSLDNRRASLSTPVHMNVNSNNVRHLSTPQIHLSSIPMSNGSPPPESPSFTTTTSTHLTWSSPYPSSISTNLGHEVGSGGRVTYPPAPAVLPHSHSAPGNLQQYGLQDQTGTAMHSTHPGIPHVSSDPISISSMQEKFRSKGTSSPQPYDPITSTRPPSAKKKKKSKMHACTVCRKEFPRPSGLSTHMNTHTKQRPFPCTYGCGSYFGVQSNAKRHLRTHGIPTWTSNSVAGPSTRQNQSGDNSRDHSYVVGFSKPLVGGNPSSSSGILEEDGCGLEGNRTTRGPKRRKKRVGGNGKSQSSPSFRKLRWMPLNLTSRTNISDVKNLIENETNEYEENEGEEELEEEVPRTTKEEFSD